MPLPANFSKSKGVKRQIPWKKYRDLQDSRNPFTTNRLCDAGLRFPGFSNWQFQIWQRRCAANDHFGDPGI